MFIGEVARRSGISAPAIRFYEAEKLVSRPARSSSGYRMYSQRVLDELGFIKCAQRLGFTLDETREILNLGRSGRVPCDRVAALCERHLKEIARRIAELQTFQRHLRRAQHQAEKGCGFTAAGFCRAVAAETSAGDRE